MAKSTSKPTTKTTEAATPAAPRKASAKAPAKAPRKASKASKEVEVEEPLTPEELEAEKAVRGKKLVIVESPAKAKTINKYLGKDFVVRASMGHIRDLPKGKLGIDVEHGFKPAYTTIVGKTKIVSELKRLADKAPQVYLAPDLDREGEAIAWHLFELLGVDASKVYRVVFNEITKKAILEAFEHPGKLNMDKVDAQQARRVLDRIMGYKLSPLLWKKIAKGLSAGRVQSVAVRLIVEREKEIRAFIKEEYWRVTAHFSVDGQTFDAELRRLGEERIDKNLDEARARGLVARIGKQPLELVEIENKPKTRRPTPPFTTSQLQQKASTMLRFSAKKTMMLAQQLYEGVELPGEGSVGLITYMRTDSVRVSEDALAQVRDVIGKRFGEAYVPEKPHLYTGKAKGAQEAHEAIRPTDATRTPEALRSALTTDQHKLYTLIWNKFVASQMKPSASTITTAVFQNGDARFVAQGEVQLFDGHLRVFDIQASVGGQSEEKDAESKLEQSLPKSLALHERYTPSAIDPTQHFTQPPPRYSEATLVKELEKKGIGRPSTYATIISTIQDRGYVNLEQRRFAATELGEIVTEQLVAHFGDVINSDFTSSMEADLDRIESGEKKWEGVVRTFHDVFIADLAKAEKAMTNIKLNPTLSDKLCDKCGAPMAILFNKRGKFLGCSKYPECRNTMSMDGPREKSEVVETDKKCEKCEKPMVIRTGSRGRFMACTGFPKCRNTYSVDENGEPLKPKETGIACDKCSSPMIIKGSKRGPFLACSAYPKCRNAKPLPEELREKPVETGEICDKCGAPMILKKTRWGKDFLACSAYPKCKNARDPKKPGEGASVPAAVEAGDESADAPAPIDPDVTPQSDD